MRNPPAMTPLPTAQSLNPSFIRANWPAICAGVMGQPFDRERDLQAACEGWLDSLGYVRSTAANAERFHGLPVAGWYWHLHTTTENPFLPDLCIVADPQTRKPLLVELKVPKGKRVTRIDWRPGQQEMVQRGQWKLCCDAWQFLQVVRNWEELDVKKVTP